MAYCLRVSGLGKLSSTDWHQLRWNILGLLNYGTDRRSLRWDSSRFKPGESWCTAEEVLQMHGWLSFGFKRLREGAVWPMDVAGSVDILPLPPRARPSAELEYKFLSISRLTSLTEIFKERVYEDLKSQMPRLRGCPECHQLFLLKKRQTYCTSTCSQTVRTRDIAPRTRTKCAGGQRTPDKGTRRKDMDDGRQRIRSTKKKDADAPRGLFRHLGGVWGLRFTCGAGTYSRGKGGPCQDRCAKDVPRSARSSPR
jgi:hypothetical protein